MNTAQLFKLPRTQISHTNATEMDYLSQLPDELIINILKYLDDKTQMHISMVSKQFNDIIHKFFLDTAYGQGLKFQDWENNLIDAFIEQVNALEKKHTLSPLNRPDLDLPFKITYYVLLTISSLFVLSNFNKKLNDSEYFVLVLLILLISYHIHQAKRNNNDYQRHTLISPTDIGALTENKKLLPTALINFLEDNDVTVTDLRTKLTTLSQEIAQHSQSIENFFLSLRFKKSSKLTTQDLDKLIDQNPASREYIENTLGFWMKHANTKTSPKSDPQQTNVKITMP